MDKPTVLITETLDPRAAAWLEEHANVVWRKHDEGVAFNDALADADAAVVRTYTQVNDAFLNAAPKLRVVGRAGVGLDNIDLGACEARGIPVVYTPDANSQAVVEYVFALIFDRIRPRIDFAGEVKPEAFHAMRKEHVGTQLDQLTLGILGFGRIGKRIGQVAHAMGVNLRVNDLLPEPELRKAVDYPFDYVDKESLYARSDILTIHTDGRASNLHLIDADALSQLKPSCLLINAARGMLVDHHALANWLKRDAVQREGGYAVLDVHDPEPPPPDYPLLGLPNARLLPHLASRTDTAMLNMSWVVRDVMAVLRGESPSFPAW